MQSQLRATFDSGLYQFFRRRLLSSSREEVVELIDQLDKEANQIREQSLKLAWYMRGGITYDQVLQLSPAERQMISDLAKDNLETTKKSGLPFF